jgi:D-3-phosphoglycerate dehydrogenase
LEHDYQEGVAIEIAEAVVGALKGELAATAVNAPMVPSEVLEKIISTLLVY